jgi:hypothetical protein
MRKQTKGSENIMRKTNVTECSDKLSVDINGLQAMLSCGKVTAAKIGEQAGAVIKVGRRKFYSVGKVQAYIDKLTEA